MDRRNVRKIFIQRDYSRGTGVRFSTDFPRELTGKVCKIHTQRLAVGGGVGTVT